MGEQDREGDTTKQRDTFRPTPSLIPGGTMECRWQLMVVLPQDRELGLHAPSQALRSWGPACQDVNSGTSWPLFSASGS